MVQNLLVQLVSPSSRLASMVSGRVSLLDHGVNRMHAMQMLAMWSLGCFDWAPHLTGTTSNK